MSSNLTWPELTGPIQRCNTYYHRGTNFVQIWCKLCLIVIAGNGTSWTLAVSMVVKIGLLLTSAKELWMRWAAMPKEKQIMASQNNFSIMLLHSIRYLNPWIVVTSKYSVAICLTLIQRQLFWGILLPVKRCIITYHYQCHYLLMKDIFWVKLIHWYNNFFEKLISKLAYQSIH